MISNEDRSGGAAPSGDRLESGHAPHDPHTRAGGSSIGEEMAETWVRTLETSAELDRPWVEAAVDWLVAEREPGAVVDVGCGAGGAACAFARRLSAGSMVAAFDRDSRLVGIARQRAGRQGVGDRIRWAVADVALLPLKSSSADLVWASGVVHHLADQQEAVRSLAGLVQPGGRVVLVEGGLPLRSLPHEIGLGRPGLESRLDEARARWFVDMRSELHGPPLPYGWAEALARAGLVEITSRSFVTERTPPLDEVGWAAVEQHLRSAFDELGDRLDPEDRATLARLLDPDDPAHVRRRTDLMVTAVRAVHTATRPPHR